MRYNLLIKPNAVEALHHAYIWYEEQQRGLGDRFFNEIERCYDALETQRDIFRKIRRNYRQIICHIFPYVVIYEIIKNEVVIYSIFHTSLHPGKKFKFQK